MFLDVYRVLAVERVSIIFLKESLNSTIERFMFLFVGLSLWQFSLKFEKEDFLFHSLKISFKHDFSSLEPTKSVT